MPRSAAADPRSAKNRRYTVCACQPARRRVLQLVRTAPRVEGAGVTHDSAKGRRYSVCACQPRTAPNNASRRRPSPVECCSKRPSLPGKGGSRTCLPGRAGKGGWTALLEKRSFVQALTAAGEGAVLQKKTPCRRVLQLIRAAPRAEGTLSAPVSMQGAAPRVEGAAAMPDGRCQKSKAYCCLSLQPQLRAVRRAASPRAVAACPRSAETTLSELAATAACCASR